MDDPTDRELLELAAKAAGIKGEYVEERRLIREFCFVTRIYIKTNSGEWNPLTDDGDSLRLAVRLGISVDLPDPEKLVTPHSPIVDARQEGCAAARITGHQYRSLSRHLVREGRAVHWVSRAEFDRVKGCKDAALVKFWRDAAPEKFETAYTATRRAIVLVAAEIGKSMEKQA